MATKSVVYVGENPEGVLIADTGQWAEHGKPIEVDAEVAKSLLEQSGWDTSTKTKSESKEK